MRERGFKSCDVSEPIRCAKVVSAPENPLPHPFSGADTKSCDLSDWIGRSVTANDRRERMRERIWEKISNF